MTHEAMIWIGFVVFVLLMLAVDLFVFHRQAHEVRFKEAVGWSIVWIALGVAFSGVVYWEYEYRRTHGELQPLEQAVETAPPPAQIAATAPADPTDSATSHVEPVHTKHNHLLPRDGKEAAIMYLTGYVVEKALSMDNLFVILLIFGYFGVKPMYQHRVLFWGIVGALVFRAVFIFAGVALINRFHWIIYVFGAFLVYTGLKMAFEKEKEIHPEKNPVLNLCKRIMPVTHEFHGEHFFVSQAGKWVATPLFITLIMVETTDIIFAVDSIPAILAISSDPFIVFTSNVFAILGLRALYFALAGFMKLFTYLGYGLALILVFVGVKMLIADFYHFPTIWSLAVIGGILTISVTASILWGKKDAPPQTPQVH